jgi:hypothetical protein
MAMLKLAMIQRFLKIYFRDTTWPPEAFERTQFEKHLAEYEAALAGTEKETTGGAPPAKDATKGESDK